MKEHTLTVSIFVTFTKAIYLKLKNLKECSVFPYLQLTFWRCDGFLFKLKKLKQNVFLVNFPKVSLILEIRSKIVVPKYCFIR